MDDPWFGKKGDGYTGGPVNLKGWAAVIVLPVCAFACYKLLPFPGNFLGAGFFLMILIFLLITKYDPETESW